MSVIVDNLFNLYNMSPDNIHPVEIGRKVMEHMLSGINGNVIDMPMIPTYLSYSGNVPYGEKVIVIDAGGTNYRCGLASFDKNGCSIEHLYKSEMPGTMNQSVTWDEFIEFIVDSIEPFINESDKIGFCFSYSADILPSRDGVVNIIDKEVEIINSEGKAIGESINKIIIKRGYSPKKIVILNDTVAALFGGSFSINQSDYSSLSGVICGTGFNICIQYLNMIYNCEAGFFSEMPVGEADRRVDLNSNAPGEKLIEKMISGAYLGSVCYEMILLAGRDCIISEETYQNFQKITSLTSYDADALTHKLDNNSLVAASVDMDIISEICIKIFERSAKSAVSALIGVILLENNFNKPAYFCMEGSLISKSEYFKKFLFENMDKYVKDELGLNYVISIGHDTTLPGAAFASLINS